MKKANNEAMQDCGGVRSPSVLTRTFSNTLYDIYLDDEIGSPSAYREVYHALAAAGPSDLVKLHLNTVGGRLDAGIQLINHIRNCDATVIGVLHMECASMGSGIFLACDDWEISSFSTMMIHSCSYGAVGKQSDIRSRVDFTTTYNEDFIRQNYTGFLDEDEIQRVLKGEDLYFKSKEIDKRLEKFQEYRDKEEIEPEEEIEEEVELVVTTERKSRSKKKETA